MNTQTPHRSFRFVLAAAALVAMNACASGQSSYFVPASPRMTTAGSANVAFTMHWTSGSVATSSSRRRPMYVPATARSVSISVNGATPQFLNSPATTLTISAPAGIDTFTIQTFDEQNGLGNVLSKANITQTVVVNTANVLSATLNGVIASVKVSLSSTFNAGAPGSMSVDVVALDADGNTIVGPGDFSSPIQLSVVDPSSSGTLSLSSTLIQTPGQTSTLSYTGGTLASANVAASSTGATTASTIVAPVPTIYEYALSNPNATPYWITAGPDGNMWFPEAIANKIGKITPSGTVSEYAVPTANAKPNGIAAGRDGNLWFTEQNANKLGKITSAGVVTEFPGCNAFDAPVRLMDRGDGNIWYTGEANGVLCREDESNPTSSNGSFATLPGPFGIAQGSDGQIYVATLSGQIEAFNASGVVTANVSVGGKPYDIVGGPDGNLWYTDSQNSSIVKIAPGALTNPTPYLIPTPSAQLVGITVGADGALWFTEAGGNKIGRITTSGAITQFPVPTAIAGPGGIAAGPDGSIWFVESSAGTIGRLVY